jgi:hypothetical protein
VRVTHPFHPRFGRTYRLLAFRQTWGADRVYFEDETGTMVSLPTAWTDVAAADPFVVAAAGRSALRLVDLLALADLVARVRR